MTTVTTCASKRHRAPGWPAEVTSFVGRRCELTEIKRLLEESHLVTLTGVAGVGKTRLALRIVANVGRAFPDGVWLVDLTALENPELLIQAVAEAMKVPDCSSQPPIEMLIKVLSDKRALIVLDNCEHLLRECAMVAEALICAAPDLRILATSRQALGIACEQTLEVPTLLLPSSDTKRLSTRSLAEVEAVRLFIDRARAILPHFEITAANRDAVEQICRRLDGIPLAIELAVVRLRALSAQQLLDRLDDRFSLLATGSRTERQSHRTLRALIDWSYALCTDKEQLLWARASVFAGGLDLEAAEAVCSGDGIARCEVVDPVTGLVEKSILIREEYPHGVRYKLLETIRQYGRERLIASGQEMVLQRRHRDYFQEMAARSRAHLFSHSQLSWLTRLRLDHANLRTALEFSLTEPSSANNALIMAADLIYHWTCGSYRGEGRHWLGQALAIVTEPTEIRARALREAAWLAIKQGDIASATSMLDESREIGEKLGQEFSPTYTALYSGLLAMNQGDLKAAVTLYEDAASGCRAADDPVGLAVALNRLSLVHSIQGDLKRAIAAGEESVALCDSYGESWHKAYGMMALGVAFWLQGNAGRAAELEMGSLRFNLSVDDPGGGGVNLEVLAWIAAAEGQYQRAARLLGVTQPIWQEIGVSLSDFEFLNRYHDECELRTRQALGSAFPAAIERGAKLTWEEACAYALQKPAPSDKEPEGTGRLSPLTRREAEVALLVAQGMSNKEIAASLVIAQRTAEGHVEHILSKLGFSSRTQVAVWAAEQNSLQDTME